MPRAQTTPPEPTDPQPADPDLQKMVAAFGMFLASTVVLTALYGPPVQSERAFRILHWWKRKPEPEADERGAVRAKRR